VKQILFLESAAMRDRMWSAHLRAVC